MAITTQREEVAFPSSPDPRFGGNLARGTDRAQYPSGLVRGQSGVVRAPMVDRRYENYQAPHRVDYTRNAPPQSTGIPNFYQRDPKGTHDPNILRQRKKRQKEMDWLYGKDTDQWNNPFYPPKQHPNPRMRGMGGGLGSLQEGDPPYGPFAAVDPSDWRTIIKILEAGGDPGTETAGIGSTNEYQMAELSGQQGDWMGSAVGNPEHYRRSPQGFEDYKRAVQGQAENWGHGFLGLGGQEDATDQEIKDRLLQNLRNKKWGDDTPSLRNFKEWGIV